MKLPMPKFWIENLFAVGEIVVRDHPAARADGSPSTCWFCDVSPGAR
jgi:hypothetical protein